LERRWTYPGQGSGFDLECGHHITYDQLKAWRKGRTYQGLVYCQLCAAIPHPITGPKD